MSGGWAAPPTSGYPFLDKINEQASALQAADPGAFPALRQSEQLVLLSDYGRHQESGWETYSFLVTTADALGEFESRLRDWRKEAAFPDERRMAYKKLGDAFRSRALQSLLDVADGLNGGLFTFCVEPQLKSMFKQSGRLHLRDLGLPKRTDVNISTTERAWRVSVFAADIASGLGRADQDILWVTDDDSTSSGVGNRSFTHQMFTATLGDLLAQTGRVQFEAVSDFDSGTRSIVEDWLAVPDLAAGEWAHLGGAGLLTSARSEGQWIPLGDGHPSKVRNLAAWLIRPASGLRKLTWAISDSQDGGFRVSFVRMMHPPGPDPAAVGGV